MYAHMKVVYLFLIISMVLMSHLYTLCTVLTLKSVRDYLARIAPTESVIFDRRNGVPREVTEERSPSEVSPAWATSDEIQIVRDWFRSRETGIVLLGSDKELQVNFSDRAAFAIAGA